MYKMRFAMLLILIVNFALSGCAVFDGGKVTKTHLMPMDIAQESKPSISYVTLARGGLSETVDLPQQFQRAIENEFRQTLRESGYFSEITKENDQADIKMDVTVTNTGNPAAIVPAIITGLSLYTIPSWGTDRFEVVAKVTNRSGQHKEYVLTDTTTLVQWLPMIFVFPAKNFSVIPEVRQNMYRNVIFQMKEDGLLSTAPLVTAEQ